MHINHTHNYTFAELLIKMSSSPIDRSPKPRTQLNHPEPYLNCYYQVVNQLNFSICSASIKETHNDLALSHLQFQNYQVYCKETQAAAEELNGDLDNISHQILSLQNVLVLFVDLLCQKKCHTSVNDFEKQAEYLQVKAQLESIMQAMGIPTEVFDCENDDFLNRLFVALHHRIVQDQTRLLHVELLHRRTDLDVRLRSLAITFRTPIEKFAQKLIEKTCLSLKFAQSMQGRQKKTCFNPLTQVGLQIKPSTKFGYPL